MSTASAALPLFHHISLPVFFSAYMHPDLFVVLSYARTIF